MRAGFEEYFPLTPDQIKTAWEGGIFVFDTNVLLGLYRITGSARTDLLTAFEKIKDRIWLPHQVALEYHRRRSIAAFKVEQELGELCRKMSDLMGTLKASFNHRNSVVASGLSILEESATAAIAKIETMQESVHHKPTDDPLLVQLSTLFNDNRIGKPYTAEELENKYTEAEMRFQKEIPPGYLDAKGKKPKPKPRCYNDYILWSQTLDMIRTIKAPLVFVTNEGDEDWWRLEGADEDESDRSKKKRIGPRVELTREALEAGAPAYIQLTAETFLSDANKHLQFNVNAGVIEQVKRAVITRMNSRCAFYSRTRELLTPEEDSFIHKLWPNHEGIIGRTKLIEHLDFITSHPRLATAMMQDAIGPGARMAPSAKKYLSQILAHSASTASEPAFSLATSTSPGVSHTIAVPISLPAPPPPPVTPG